MRKSLEKLSKFVSKTALPLYLLAGATAFSPQNSYSKQISVFPDKGITISQAMSQAESGDEIILYPGTYSGKKHGSLIPWTDGVKVKSKSQNRDDTIIDLEWTGRAFNLIDDKSPENSLEGITITRGFAGSNAVVLESPHGGAIYLSNSNLKIKDVSLVWNLAVNGHTSGRGGAIHAQEGSDLTLLNSLIENNSAQQGCGINIEYSRAKIISNEIKDNVKDYYPFLFWQSTGSPGAGISFNVGSGVVSNNIIHHNSISSDSSTENGRGAGIKLNVSKTSVINNTFVKNDATDEEAGGGVYTSSGRTNPLNYTILRNNLFYKNHAKPGTNSDDIAISDPDYINASHMYLGEIPLRFEYYNGKDTIQIGTTPSFVSETFSKPEDFMLQSNSPCIDAGTEIDWKLHYLTPEELSDPDISHALNHDFFGNPRKFGDAPDIGAYEFTRASANDWMMYR
jgi:hypothetical protein